jgi:uncharacterized circularly permuted ATP-grasp superfamily protein
LGRHDTEDRTPVLQSQPLPIDLAAREFDEMVDGSGAIRPHWRALVGALHSMPDGAFAERVARVQRQHRDIAVAYDIDTDHDGETRRPCDLLPLLLTADEWTGIAAAVVQRARLMEGIVADVYGPRRLIREGLVPPALLYANPRFLRPCAGTGPAGGYLNLYAADLVRAPDGSWLVAGDRVQAAAGIGFALHNRSVLARIVPELFRSYQLQRIEPFFEIWKASLEALAPAPTAQPRIVVLSPGPFNVAYFEHVLVARQLGAMLVEGADLTLRDGRIFVKTLGPLQPVDVILRFMDDDFCDPLELRGQSMIGVAGLLQAVRGGTVSVVNALGSGVAEVPALRPFLPRLCEVFLGETLAMPSVATEWPLDAAREARGLKPAFLSRREEQGAFDHAGRAAQGPSL